MSLQPSRPLLLCECICSFSLTRPSGSFLLPFAVSVRPQLDKYAPCVSLIDDVFRLKARGLLVAGYASAVMLAWFGSLMYLAERDDEAVKVRRLLDK